MSVYDEIERISDEREQWYRDLAQANRDGLTGAFVDELFRRSDELDAQVEQLRRQHFPRRHRLVVTTMGAFTSSPTGRAVRSVWDRDPARA